MSRQPIMITLAGLLAATLSGCGITNPYRSQPTKRPATTSASTSSTITTAADSRDPASERDGTIPVADQAAQHKVAVGAATSTPQAALEQYARLYVNWQASSLIARQRKLASISLGPARAQALQAAASAARDPELTRSQVANQGQLIAITQGRGPASAEWVLVTREHTTGQGDYAGLPPTLHVIYAQVTKNAHGYVVSQWQPQT